MYCTNCGKEIDNAISFCPYCGTRVTQTKSQEDIEKKQAHDAWRAQMSQRLGQPSATAAPPIAPEEIPEPDYSSPPPIPPTAFADTSTKGTPKKAKKPIFKRWWFWVIAVILGLMVIGSGGESDDSNNPVEPNEQIEATSDSTPEITIAETVIYEESGIRITVKGIENSIFGTDIKLLVENDTGTNIAVGCSDFVVNGITIHGSLYIDVAAGKKSNDVISFFASDLAAAGIEHVATINTFDAYISDTDTYMKTKDISFEIATSIAESHVQTVDDSGEVLFSQNGISVIAKCLTDDYMGGTVTVLVKNESGQDVIVQADNVSVNGFTVSVLHSDAVCNGTVRFCEIDLFQSDLEENEIENIEEVTFSLSVLNPKTFETIIQTGELSISAGN